MASLAVSGIVTFLMRALLVQARDRNGTAQGISKVTMYSTCHVTMHRPGAFPSYSQHR